MKLTWITFILHISDLRDTNPDTCITTSEAEAFAIDHNLPYCETSALNQIGLEACFETAVSW